MKVAIVHYWLLSMRGGEKVVEELCRMFPDADVFTHVYDPEGVSETIRRHQVRTTFIARLPRARRWYQRYLPLMPLALEALDLRGYDLVISSESGPAMGVLVRPDALHLCYCHTPMRYVWDMAPEYLQRVPAGLRWLARLILHYLRIWNHAAAQRVDVFVANSANVEQRVRRWFRRDAPVVYPPVDVRARTGAPPIEDFFLVVGQLVGYKRVDLAIEACNRLGRRLVVIGSGEERARLERLAGPTVSFLGWQPTDVVESHLARCRAVLFPGEEDFGMVPVEAMASGRPVVAYARGGALESVVDGQTGVLFHEQTAAGLIEAIERCERLAAAFDPAAMHAQAQRFSADRFRERLQEIIAGELARRSTPAAKS